MNQSIDKEKSPKKTFSALDKIKKSKKNQVPLESVSEENTQFNLDNVFKSKNPEVVQPILSTKIPVKEDKIVEVKTVKVEPEVQSKNSVKPETVVETQKYENFDIASRLLPNDETIPEQTLKPVNMTIEEVVEIELKPETRTSAEIAKDRLREDVLGERRPTPVFTETLESKRAITASDNLHKMLGQPDNQAQETSTATIYEDEESEDNNVVITKKSIFIPWDKAPIEEKRKARKIMTAGVATTLVALTYLTFH